MSILQSGIIKVQTVKDLRELEGEFAMGCRIINPGAELRRNLSIKKEP